MTIAKSTKLPYEDLLEQRKKLNAEIAAVKSVRQVADTEMKAAVAGVEALRQEEIKLNQEVAALQDEIAGLFDFAKESVAASLETAKEGVETVRFFIQFLGQLKSIGRINDSVSLNFSQVADYYFHLGLFFFF